MRLLIVGLPGSGKTFLARHLAKEWDVPHLEMDKFFWAEGDFLQKVREEIEKPNWIIEGHFTKIQDIVLPKADALIWLNPSSLMCWVRVLRRACLNPRLWKSVKLKGQQARTQAFQSAYELFKKEKKLVVRTHSLRPHFPAKFM